MRYRIYVAGPMSNGENNQMGYYTVVHNIRQGLEAGRKLADLGYAPLVPHMDHFNALFQAPGSYCQSLEIDDAWLIKADGVLRLSGPSKGADAEVALAVRHKIPVFTSIESLDEYFTGGEPYALHRTEPPITPRPLNCAVSPSTDEQRRSKLLDYAACVRAVEDR